MGKRTLMSIVIIFCAVFLNQIVMAGTLSQDEIQNKQIKIIASELNRIGKNIDNINKEIETIVKNVSGVEKKNAKSVNDVKNLRRNNISIAKSFKKAKNRITELEEKQELLYKGLAKIEMQSPDSSKKVVTSSVDGETINSLNEDIATLKKDINEIKSLLASKTEKAKVVPIVNYKSTNSYQKALTNFRNKNYRKSISQFRVLVSGNDIKLKDNSQYWIAECYYALGNYKQSINEFEKVFTFNETGKYDDAQLKLGYCYKQLKDNRRAIEEFERLIQYYPESEYKKIALKQISILR